MPVATTGDGDELGSAAAAPLPQAGYSSPSSDTSDDELSRATTTSPPPPTDEPDRSIDGAAAGELTLVAATRATGRPGLQAADRLAEFAVPSDDELPPTETADDADPCCGHRAPVDDDGHAVRPVDAALRRELLAGAAERRTGTAGRAGPAARRVGFSEPAAAAATRAGPAPPTAASTRRERQAERSRAYFERREAQRAVAARFGFAGSTPAPLLGWLVWTFAHRLRAMADVARVARARQQLAFHRLVRAARVRRAETRRLLEQPPRSIRCDVGYDASTGVFTYRDVTGRVSSVHPATDGGTVVAYAADGTFTQPMLPPAESGFVLAPEASGAWCYYHTELGTAQWLPPEGSEPLTTVTLATSITADGSPPMLPRDVGLGNLPPWIGWSALHRDTDSRTLLVHVRTGAMREGPWISLRSCRGGVYYANLVSREVRWAAPLNWMRSWVSRQLLPPEVTQCLAELARLPWSLDRVQAVVRDSCAGLHRVVLGDRFAYSDRAPLPLLCARECVEGGAPPCDYDACMHGLPQYEPDAADSWLTYPLPPSAPAGLDAADSTPASLELLPVYGPDRSPEQHQAASLLRAWWSEYYWGREEGSRSWWRSFCVETRGDSGSACADLDRPGWRDLCWSVYLAGTPSPVCGSATDEASPTGGSPVSTCTGSADDSAGPPPHAGPMLEAIELAVVRAGSLLDLLIRPPASSLALYGRVCGLAASAASASAAGDHLAADRLCVRLLSELGSDDVFERCELLCLSPCGAVRYISSRLESLDAGQPQAATDAALQAAYDIATAFATSPHPRPDSPPTTQMPPLELSPRATAGWASRAMDCSPSGHAEGDDFGDSKSP